MSLWVCGKMANEETDETNEWNWQISNCHERPHGGTWEDTTAVALFMDLWIHYFKVSPISELYLNCGKSRPAILASFVHLSLHFSFSFFLSFFLFFKFSSTDFCRPAAFKSLFMRKLCIRKASRACCISVLSLMSHPIQRVWWKGMMHTQKRKTTAAVAILRRTGSK